MRLAEETTVHCTCTQHLRLSKSQSSSYGFPRHGTARHAFYFLVYRQQWRGSKKKLRSRPNSCCGERRQIQRRSQMCGHGGDRPLSLRSQGQGKKSWRSIRHGRTGLDWETKAGTPHAGSQAADQRRPCSVVRAIDRIADPLGHRAPRARADFSPCRCASGERDRRRWKLDRDKRGAPGAAEAAG